MAFDGEERRLARWTCLACRSPRFAQIPEDGRLKCPICYTAVTFEARKHARRDPSDRGKAPDDLTPHA